METTFKIFLRTDNTNIDGSNSIYLLFTSKRKLKKISLGINTHAQNWDAIKTKVKKSDIEYLRKNKYLRAYHEKAQTIIDKYFFEDMPLSINEFERNFKNNSFGTTSFYDFIESEVKNLDIAKATIKDYKTQTAKLKKYSPELSFSDIDLTFIQNYDLYLKNKLNNGKNTRLSSFKFMKSVINKAIKKGAAKTNPFKDFKVQKIEGNREHLTIDELHLLETLLANNDFSKSEQKSLIPFLFDCYTGLRHGDFKNFRYKNIKKSIINGAEYEFIEIDMHKTGKPVIIPIIPSAKKFIKAQKYRIPNRLVFDMFSEQYANRVLKMVMKKANIDKNISFHCARHTLGNVGADLGIPIEVISAILGHSAIKTTQIYSKISKKRMVEEMEKFGNY